MPVSQQLLRKLRETLWAEAADDLVNLMDGLDSNRGDTRELRHEMQLGFARIDARFVAFESEIKAHIAKELTTVRVELGTELAAVREEVGTLRGEVGTLRGEVGTLRGDFGTATANFERLLEKGLREQTRFFFLAWSVLLAGVIGLYTQFGGPFIRP